MKALLNVWVRRAATWTSLQQLEELLTVLIGGLPDNPVTGQKQLLELYAEVLRMNGHCVTDDKVRERLGMWKKNANLKKVVTALGR